MHHRIVGFENFLKEFQSHLIGYSKKLIKLKEEETLLVNLINKYGQEEFVNSHLKCALIQFGEYFSAVQDYRTIQIQLFESKLIDDINKLNELCKKAKEEARKNINSKSKLNGSNRIMFANHLDELVGPTFEMNMEQFETKKLTSLKKYFKDFSKIQLLFHSKSLELFSKAHKQMIEMDENADLELFRDHFEIRFNLSSTKKSQSESINIAGSLKRFSSHTEIKSLVRDEHSKQNQDEIGSSDSD